MDKHVVRVNHGVFRRFTPGGPGFTMFSKCQECVAAITMAAIISIVGPAAFGSGPSFHPEFVMNDANLEGWTVLGNAIWTPANGEVRGTPHDGGWLMLDHSLEDVNFYTEFRCSAGCETGVLLRAEKTPDGGRKGIYVSLSDPDTGAYSVTLDAGGKITDRHKLPRGGGLMRVAPPPVPGDAANANRPHFPPSRPISR